MTLTSLPRFEQSLDKWFKRKGVRIWITEYGHETKQDGEPNGVSRAQQAAYTTQAIGLAKKDPRVDMFIWFIFRDDATSVWQSGLPTKSGAAKPRSPASAPRRSPSTRGTRSSRSRGGVAAPAVAVPLRELAANLRSGDTVGINFRVFLRGRQVATGQPATTLGPDASPASG